LALTTTTGVISQIQDSSKALQAFFYTCLQAGKSVCAFAASSTTTAQLSSRYAALDESLKKRSLKVTGFPDGFDWSHLHSLVSAALHSPSELFPLLSDVLTEAENKKPQTAIPFVLANLVTGSPQPTLAETLAGTGTHWEGILSGVAIDGATKLKTDNDYRHYRDDLLAAVPTTGPVFASWRLAQMYWQIETINRAPANLTSGVVNLSAGGGKVVVMANVADPAASIAAAESVASKFSPSVIIKNLGAGHTSFQTLNGCFFGIIYQLFVLDLLPDPSNPCDGLFAPPFGVQLPPNF
jgi:hypothetical protein